ncbi:MAG: hypothetical protein ACLP0J_31095 [Solirubrobacteraceae bacterium]
MVAVVDHRQRATRRHLTPGAAFTPAHRAPVAELDVRWILELEADIVVLLDLHVEVEARRQISRCARTNRDSELPEARARGRIPRRRDRDPDLPLAAAGIADIERQEMERFQPRSHVFGSARRL